MAVLGTIGFRDLPLIGHCSCDRPGCWSTKFVKQPPLVRRSRRFEIEEQLGINGALLRPLSDKSVSTVCASLAESPPDVVVICFSTLLFECDP